MTTNTYSFTAFTQTDLFGKVHVRPFAKITMPDAPTLSVTVTDNDSNLSGDARYNEMGDDRSDQKATILAGDAEIGNGKTLYIEQIWRVTGSDGEHYRLAELEQPGFLEDNFTFVGSVPPAGVELTLRWADNVTGHGISYGELSSGTITPPTPNIVEIAAGSDDFNILVAALTAADLVGAVQASEDITVFAPTDAAFTQLAVDLGFTGDTSSEADVTGFILEALTGLSPDGDPIPLLSDILLYHVSPGAKTAAEVDAADQITTLLTGATFGSEGTELTDNEPDVTNPNIVAEDIAASNGTIQVIDRVLLPIDIPGNEPVDPPAPTDPTIAGLVAASGGVFDSDGGDFDLLLNAVQAAGLVDALNDPAADLTVFAPTDAAFVGLANALGYAGSDEEGAFGYIVEALKLLGGGDAAPLLTDVLTYHVSPGAKDAGAVLSSSSIATLQGGTLGVDGTTLVDAEPDVANPDIVATDIPASNGIVHAINGVLLPADLLQSDGSGDVDFVVDGDGKSFIRVAQDDDFVDGNGGDDKIFLGRGNDVGLGGDGDDYINGGLGDDLIIGGLGDDRLIGGGGADTFVFDSGDGRDRIIRFEKGVDKIDLTSFGFTDFSELEGHIISRSNGVRIEIEGELFLSLHLDGQTLDAGDFIL